MKFTYAAIRQNIRFYERAKESLPIISQFERGEVSMQSMNSLKLQDFAEFYNFKRSVIALGLELDKPLSWRKLKPILVKHTKCERFKVYLGNRTQKEFIKLISQNGQTFDRLLNGRWLRRPSRRSYGKRHHEKCDGLSVAFVSLMNFIISNEIDTYSVGYGDDFKSFHEQDVFYNVIKWFMPNYLGVSILESSISRIPTREVELSTKMLKSLANFIQSSELDFRKLNSDFIIESVSRKIKDLMQVPTGTSLKCIEEVKNELTIDKHYWVIASTIHNGFVRVCVLSDRAQSQYYDYQKFEDVSIMRNSILQELGIN